MSLYTALQKVRTEEDDKDVYIKALGIKGYTKGLIDIQSKDISRTMCALMEYS